DRSGSSVAIGQCACLLPTSLWVRHHQGRKSSNSMSMKLFVGGLSWDTDTDGLRRGFESFGQLEDVAVIQDRDTGRSRGFGFVTFSDVDAGRTAMTAMDGADLDGRSLRVNEAAERAPRSGG